MTPSSNDKPFVETPLEWFGGRILRSTVRPATAEEVAAAQDQFRLTQQCNHSIIFDQPGFAFYLRFCFTCGHFVDCI